MNTEELQGRFMDSRQVKVADIQIPLLMEPGDTVLMHPRLIHGSWPNTSNESRHVLINGFSSPGANHRQYPGAGSARRISLIDGKEIDMILRTSVKALIDMKTEVRHTATISAPISELTPTFH